MYNFLDKSDLFAEGHAFELGMSIFMVIMLVLFVVLYIIKRFR